MIVLVVALAPLVLGFVLIALIARYSPNVPRHAAPRPGQIADDRPAITPEEFEDIVKELMGALGLEIVFSSAGTGGVLELICRDPRPLTGGRLLVHASPVVGAGQVDAAEVLGFADSVRGGRTPPSARPRHKSSWWTRRSSSSSSASTSRTGPTSSRAIDRSAGKAGATRAPTGLPGTTTRKTSPIPRRASSRPPNNGRPRAHSLLGRPGFG